MNKIMKINDPIFRSNQLQINALSNEAIHNMLNLVDSSVICQQCTEDIDKDSKLLGADSWRYIYYLGFWKKLIYLMDTHNSLKLCFSIGAFEDFKTVYLVFYRPELTNDQIKAMVGDPLTDWIGVNKTALVEYLCRKVALEESMATLDNTSLHPSCECNINLNNCLKASREGNQQLSIECLGQAVAAADQRFIKVSNQKKLEIDDIEKLDKFSEECFNNPELIETNLPLFDVFLFYGRILANKHLKGLIKDSIDQGQNIRHKAMRMSNFIARLVHDSSKLLKTFSSSKVRLMLQGLYIPFKVRISEQSDL